MEAIVGGLEPSGWDPAWQGQYESTLDLIDLVIGTYSAKIYTATSVARAASTSPDADSWRQAVIEASADRERLLPDDAEAIQRTRQKYREILERLQAEDAATS